MSRPDTRIAYDAGAHIYHARRLARSRAWEATYAAELRAVLPEGSRVAALGSGTGEELEALEAQGVSVLGLDLSRSMLEIARRCGRARLVQADLCALPFATASLDGAWSVAAFLHLERDALQDAFDEVARVIRPGGALLLVTKHGKGEVWQTSGGLLPRRFTFMGEDEACTLASRSGLTPEYTRIDASDVPWLVLRARRDG